MGKAIRIFVVLLLVLSIASLTLGIMLFNKREMLKGRTQKLEQSTQSIAKNIRYEDLDMEKVKDYQSMDQQLNLFAGKADGLYVELQDTKLDLENARQELALTKGELNTTKQGLASARDQTSNLETDLAEKREDRSVAKDQIAQLEQEKEGLVAEVGDLKNELSTAEEQVQDLQDEVDSLEKVLAQIEREKGQISLPPGLAGNILVVNDAWNFVVLDIGSEVGLIPNVEMMIHRKNKLIGKVRVNSVQEDMSVADIIRDWERAPVKQGDQVLYALF